MPEKIELSAEQEVWLKNHYRDTDNETIAMELGVSRSTVQRMARRRGLKKGRAFMEERRMEGVYAARESHIRNGTYPKKGVGVKNCERTWFHKGQPGFVLTDEQKERRSRSRAETVAKERRRIEKGLRQRTGLWLKGGCNDPRTNNKKEV